MRSDHLHRVFIVDDSEPIRARLVDSLARIEGLRLVGVAASARDAIAGILRTRPDSVLLDLNLMGHSGLEVVWAIRPRLPATVFVVLTNHSESQYRAACLDAGTSFFLDKSSEFDRVGDVLAQIACTRH